MNNQDSYFLKYTLDLAKKGQGFVSPNPMVGCVIVKDDRIIGEGHHKLFGGPHAEVEAFANCDERREDASGSTVYCNLEPCCHLKKKTPPCTKLLIEKKIKRLVLINVDPNPQVAGMGIAEIKAAGIEVTMASSDIQEEGKKLNEVFFTFMTRRTPFVHAKVAQTLDGAIATKTGDSRWITEEPLRKKAHYLRTYYDAIMVGSNTVSLDNPSLTIRYNLPYRLQPWRIVIGSLLKRKEILKSHLFTDEFAHRTLAFVPEEEKEALSTLTTNIDSITFFKKEESLVFMLDQLGKKGISSLLLEGGSTLLSSFLRQHLVDKLTIQIAPKIIGQGHPSFLDLGVSQISQALTLNNLEIDIIESHIELTGYPHYRSV